MKMRSSLQVEELDDITPKMVKAFIDGYLWIRRPITPTELTINNIYFKGLRFAVAFDVGNPRLVK